MHPQKVRPTPEAPTERQKVHLHLEAKPSHFCKQAAAHGLDPEEEVRSITLPSLPTQAQVSRHTGKVLEIRVSQAGVWYPGTFMLWNVFFLPSVFQVDKNSTHRMCCNRFFYFW